MLDAIGVIRAAVDDSRQYYDLADIAVDGVIRPKWRDIVIEMAPDGSRRVNRINYEICMLQSLRERLRCKEVWVIGAERWRNPDDDLLRGSERVETEFWYSVSYQIPTLSTSSSVTSSLRRS